MVEVEVSPEILVVGGDHREEEEGTIQMAVEEVVGSRFD